MELIFSGATFDSVVGKVGKVILSYTKNDVGEWEDCLNWFSREEKWEKGTKAARKNWEKVINATFLKEEEVSCIPCMTSIEVNNLLFVH